MHIEADPCWVLVLDNADDLGLFGVGRHSAEQSKLGAFVPRGPAGTVLWTSRDERISGTLVGAQRAINVSRMTSAEAITLFETVGNRKMGVDEEDDIALLLAELDWLPLAISQAAAYTRRTRTGIKTYLSKLQQGKRRWKALKESEFDRHRREHVSNSILETWRISIEHIRRENEMAYRILHILAFTDNQNIPKALIKCAATYGNEVGEAQTDSAIRDLDSPSDNDDDDEEIIGAITRLREFSFLSVRASSGGSQAYEMHKLVQEATRYGLSRPEKQDMEAYFSKLALQVVSELFPVPERNSWSECEKYVVHAQRVSEWDHLRREEKDAPALLWRVADYLYHRGRWREKEAVDDKVYMLCKKALGDRHRDTLLSMGNLATTYFELGRYDIAEARQIQVVTLRREILGDKDPHTFNGMSDLVTTYIRLGQCDKAEALNLEVLALRREVLGGKHPDTLHSMGELVVILYTLERYDEAEAMIVEIVALRRDVLGDNHPDTIRGVSDLASILYRLGRYNEAESMIIEVLALRREILGEKHPDTVYSIGELAIMNLERGRYDEAETLQAEVLALRREILGDKHPDTLDAMHQFSVIWHKLGRYNEAETMQVKVLAQWRETLGDNHPGTVLSMHCLAIIWYDQGRRGDALALMQNCLEICRHALQPGHPYTLSSQRHIESWQATGATPPMIAGD